MSREHPTLKGSVNAVIKGKKITFGFVNNPVPMNGYRGEIPHRVFVKEDVLGDAKLREGMIIAFDVRRPEFNKHKDKFEAYNVMELHATARS